MCVLQICISSGNWTDSGLRTSLLGESRQFCDIPPSFQTTQTCDPPKKTRKHWIQRRVLLIATGVCSLVFCPVGLRISILITWSSSDTWWLLSLRCQGVRVGSLDALCACASLLPIQLHLWALQQISFILQTTSGGPEVQRFFLTGKSALTHAVIKSLSLQCRQRAAWALSPEQDWDQKLPSSLSHCLFKLASSWSLWECCKCKSNGFFIWKIPQKANFRINNGLIVFQNTFGV